MVQDDDEWSVRYYLSVLRNRWLTILVVAVAVVVLALLWSLAQTPRYAATAEILVPRSARFTNEVVQAGGNVSVADAKRQLENQVQVVESQAVAGMAAEALGFDARVEARALEDSDVILVRSESTDATEAALVANTFAETYVEQATSSEVEGFGSARAVVDARLAELGAEIAALDDQLGQASEGATPDGRSVAQVSAERDRLLVEQSELRDSLNRLELSADLASTDRPQIINAAQVPGSPFEPTVRRNVALALIAGLVLGVSLAFLRDYMDESVKNQEQLEGATDLVTLATVPTSSQWKDRDRPFLVSLSDPESGAAEGFRALRTALQYIALARPMRTLLVTSAQPGEGKTTTAANLAVAFAGADQRVAVLSFDLRRPRLHRFFEVPNDVGLTSVLRGEVELLEAPVKAPGVRNLVVVPSGPPPPNPSELLSTPAAAQIIREISEVADLVIIDAPPVLPVADALICTRYADAVLMVAQAGVTSKRGVHRAVEALRKVDANPVGSVLVRVDSKGSYGYRYERYETTRRGSKRDSVDVPPVDDAAADHTGVRTAGA